MDVDLYRAVRRSIEDVLLCMLKFADIIVGFSRQFGKELILHAGMPRVSKRVRSILH